MKQRILHLLLATFAIIGVAMVTSCTSPERQLEAALNAINKQFPQPIADGATLEGFFLNGDKIDIAITMQESKQVEAITPERLQQFRTDFVDAFTQIAHQDKNVHDLFQLIADNGKTVVLSVTLMPSQKKSQVDIDANGIQSILAAQTKSSEEMALMQLDKLIANEAKTLPLNMGPLVCKAERREGKVVIWEFEVDESQFNFDALVTNPAVAKANILKAQTDPQNLNFNRLLLDAGCHIRYHYIAPTSNRTFDIEINQDDLRSIQKDATTTTIK